MSITKPNPSTVTSGAATAAMPIVATKPPVADDRRHCPCCRQGISERHRLNDTPVLIVSHHDGHLEAYTEKGVNVRLETMPYVNAESELLAEEYLELCLPRAHRNIYFAGRRTTLGKPLSANPKDIAAREYDRHLIREIQREAKP